MAQAIVTTSWDDGHVLDLKLAELLRKYGLRGTFYIAPENQEFPAAQRLTPEQIRQIGRVFEIGAHTLTHPVLTHVSSEAAAREISGSKRILEDIIGRPVTTFCSPRGAYDQSHVELIRDAGFTYARTTERFALSAGQKPLEAATTIHAYRHWSDLGPIARAARFNPMRTWQFLMNWDDLAIALFEHAHVNGGVFHLWGHSWEIDRAGDWPRLERVLAHISGHAGVKYLTNGELA